MATLKRKDPDVSSPTSSPTTTEPVPPAPKRRGRPPMDPALRKSRTSAAAAGKTEAKKAGRPPKTTTKGKGRGKRAGEEVGAALPTVVVSSGEEKESKEECVAPGSMTDIQALAHKVYEERFGIHRAPHKWTDADRALLATLVSRHGTSDWSRITNEFNAAIAGFTQHALRMYWKNMIEKKGLSAQDLSVEGGNGNDGQGQGDATGHGGGNGKGGGGGKPDAVVLTSPVDESGGIGRMRLTFGSHLNASSSSSAANNNGSTNLSIPPKHPIQSKPLSAVGTIASAAESSQTQSQSGGLAGDAEVIEEYSCAESSDDEEGED